MPTSIESLIPSTVILPCFLALSSPLPFRMESLSTRNVVTFLLIRRFRRRATHLLCSTIQASKSMEGLFSLKKKITDAISRAEMIAPLALELEEARRVKQEEVLQDCNLWDDIERSTESLSALADAIKIVNDLKDLQYKIWAEKLLFMYMRWAEKHGCKGKIIEKCAPRRGGIISATVEFESEYFYGYLSGERGTHRMIRSSLDASVFERSNCLQSLQAFSAAVNVIPIFLEDADDLHVDEEDLNISSLFVPQEQNYCKTEPVVSILHIPSGICAQSSGERRYFTNKIKALACLKAKLCVAALEQGVKDVNEVR